MIRVDGLSCRSKLDLLQRHKQVQTNTYPFIAMRGEKDKGRINKKQEKYSQSKLLF